MKRKIISVFVAFVLLLNFVPVVFAATGSLENFKKVNTYTQGQFVDVTSDSWYAPSVKAGYEMGLINGSSKTTYNPYGNMTLAEAVTLAARLHSIYNTGSTNFVQGDVWYQVYVDYAVKNGIIKEGTYKDYDVKATRAQFAVIFAAALPEKALNPINVIEPGAIPDVKGTESFGPAVYMLYNAGVLTGSDSFGTFNPTSNIQRSEVAAIVTRMADTSLRKTVNLKSPELSAEEIYGKCSPAVFYIEVADKSGKAYASGSGFFISSDGTAVTNFHVIEDAYSAKITLSSTNNQYNVSGVYDYNEAEDWAIIKIDGSGFPVLTIADPSTIVGGAKCYAIGSPKGLQNTISDGIISNPSQYLDGTTYIQTSAAISHGSSGGALINKFGQVIGITSAGYEDGENLGFAIPISRINGYSHSQSTPLSTLFPGTSSYIEKPTAQEANNYLVAFVKVCYNDVTFGDLTYEETENTSSGTITRRVVYNESLDVVLVERIEKYYEQKYYTAISYEPDTHGLRMNGKQNFCQEKVII